MVGCEICPILKSHNDGKDVQVFETKYWRGVLDSDQRSLGKMFITLLEHRESLSDLSSEQSAELFRIMRGLEIALREVYQPTHFNWQCLMNLAVEAGQSTHVHWHLHPRYDRSVTVSNEVFHDGNKEKIVHKVSHEILEKIREDIADNLTFDN